MIRHGRLVAALTALTLAAGLSGAQAEEACAALDTQVQQIKATTSETALRRKLAEPRATDPDCELVQVLMARLVDLQSQKLPATSLVAWSPY
jgi:hypothetical protein